MRSETITAGARRRTTRRPRSTRRCRSGGEARVTGNRPAREAVPTGNTYDKYGSTNPVVKRLMARFERDMFELLDHAAPSFDPRRRLRRGRADRAVGGPHARAASSASTSRTRSCARSGSAGRARTSSSTPATATRSRLRDGEFEAATAMEVLEHVPDPAAVLARDVTRRLALGAGERSARAAVAGAEHGARRLPARPRQHAGPPEPLVQAQLRRAARPPWRDRRAALALSLDDGPRPRSGRERRAIRGRGLVRPRRGAALGADRRHRAPDLRVPLARGARARRATATA